MMLPKRKAARLKGYDYCQPGAYFVTICAKGRRCLFGSIPPSSGSGNGGPMPASAPTISQRVRIFKGRVAHETGCCVFQRSFYDHIVRSEAEYREIHEYILTNPARWAMDTFYTEGEVL